MQIFVEIPFIKPQNDIYTTDKWLKAMESKRKSDDSDCVLYIVTEPKRDDDKGDDMMLLFLLLLVLLLSPFLMMVMVVHREMDSSPNTGRYNTWI